MHTGLFGPIVISRNQSMKNPDTVPEDVDREFFITTTVIDESLSHYFDLNIATCIFPPPFSLFLPSFSFPLSLSSSSSISF